MPLPSSKSRCPRQLQLGAINPTQAHAIAQACDDLIAGQLHDQFVVDVIQGGAGTSTNMNANEVIANRALEHLGLPKGRYDVVHPNDHVNASQSTNDAYPTALKLATLVRKSRRCWTPWPACAVRLKPRRVNLPLSSKSAAHNYKTPCR